jgi:hypothetical protein
MPEGQRPTVTFFQFIFGGNTGYLCVAFLRQKGVEKSFTERFYSYPEQLEQAVNDIEELTPTHNVYFCPHLLDTKSRTKNHVKHCPVVWADLDTCDPSNLLNPPSVVIETSIGRYQGYWHIEGGLDPVDGESLSRRIAYYHQREGCDISGWDLTQLLRVPYTFNRKEGYGNPPIKIISAQKKFYHAEDFDKYPAIVRESAEQYEFPAELPKMLGSEILEEYNDRFSPAAYFLFENQPAEGKWSQALWSLQMMGFEAGLTREQVYIISRDSACNKYRRDQKDERLLWKDVCRAFVKNEENITIIAPKHQPLNPIITEEELERIKGRDTFVERFIRWASSLGDAAVQYHQAGAFVALSAMLSGGVRLPTSFGTFKPNIWFMLLADTTLTRKSTAMDVAMDLVELVDSNLVLATDGSVEGLLGQLSTRPGVPSVFLRDEFSGLLESLTKKDYYAGMAEMLTKLYDGKMAKRVLKKETIEVRDPTFIIFAGGIKNKICGLLTDESISSGFVPRFVFITAESDLNGVKPIGPPTDRDTTGREDILAEMRRLRDVYHRAPQTVLKEGRMVMISADFVTAVLTPEAWDRYNKLEHEMMAAGLKSERPEIMTPTYDRLCKSMLKAAVMIAASRQDPDDLNQIGVTLDDLLHAISFGQEWREHTNEVINNVGKNTDEQLMDKIVRMINKSPGITRSNLMQQFHLTARTASACFETLVQRGSITQQQAGRTTKYFPLKVDKKQLEDIVI